MSVLTKKEIYFYEHVPVDGNVMRVIAALANALGDFEPVEIRVGVGQTSADKAVSLGLAERDECNSTWKSRGYRVGYRLTNLGWEIKERGKLPRTYQR